MVWACDDKRGALRYMKGDGNGKYRGEGTEEYLREDGWTKFSTTAQHGGVSHRASIPHKSGNNLKG